MNPKTIWVLEDNRQGHANQLRGIINALNTSYKNIKLSYNQFANLPNTIKGATLMGVDHKIRDEICSPWPDIVLSAGRKTVPIARYIKKNSNGKSQLIHIMWPGKHHQEFNTIFLPKHDNKTAIENVVHTIGAPNIINNDVLNKEEKKWRKIFAHLPSPNIAVLIGGNTKNYHLNKSDTLDLCKKINLLLKNTNGSLLITTSRRTPTDIISVLKNNLDFPFYIHDNNKTGDNPYLGILALSTAIIVTGDSISMCSEACSTGKPVYVHTPENFALKKHLRFLKILFDKGVAKPLNENIFTPWTCQPLNDANNIATYIQKTYL